MKYRLYQIRSSQRSKTVIKDINESTLNDNIGKFESFIVPLIKKIMINSLISQITDV